MRTRVSWRWLLPLVVVWPMAVVGLRAGEPGIIFPEGAALAFGIWVLAHPGWSASRWQLVVLPPGCALLGFGLADAPGPRWALECAALTGALLMLQLLGSRLAPSLSAAMFPLVFDVHAWAYPVSVLTVCLLVAAGDRLARRPPPRPSTRWAWPVLARYWAAALAWTAAGGLLPSAALAPPLFVSALEWTIADRGHWPTATRRWLLLTGAAAAGSCALWACPAEWLVPALATTGTMLLMRTLRQYHVPALAVCLIPLVTGPSPAWHFPLGVGVGTAALYGLGWLARRRVRPRRVAGSVPVAGRATVAS